MMSARSADLVSESPRYPVLTNVSYEFSIMRLAAGATVGHIGYDIHYVL